MSTDTTRFWDIDVADRSVSAEDADASKPAWFGGSQAPAGPASNSTAPPPLSASAAFSLRKRRLLVVAEESAVSHPRTWREEIAFWRGRVAGAGYVLSLLLHAAVLVVLSIALVASGKPDRGGSPIEVSEADGTVVQLDEVLDTRIAADELEARPELQPLLLDAPRTEPEQVESQRMEDELTRLFQDSLPSPGGVSAGRIGAPGNNAVTKGSFTVWTVPENPLPRQIYHIYIEMKVPARIRRLTVQDLVGSVHGTDRFVAEIPSGNSYFLEGRLKRVSNSQALVESHQAESSDFAAVRNDRERLDIIEGAALIRVRIPGADVNVRDKIRIRSKSLDEEQELEIEFSSRPRRDSRRTERPAG